MPKYLPALLGTWCHPDDDSSVEYTIEMSDEGYQVTAIDSADGEVLEVDGVSWDGTTVRFRSRTPSTDWKVEHEFRLLNDSSIEHRHSFSELWVRRIAQ